MDLKLILCFSFLCILYFQDTSGHGLMYYPSPWHSTRQMNPYEGFKTSQWKLKYPKQSNSCKKRQAKRQGKKCSNKALKKGGLTDWFTNSTFIPGNPTLPNEYYSNPRQSWKWSKHPWASPGSAPVYGEGCGVNGGNPYPMGCQYPNTDSDPFGTCCAAKPGGCGGFVGGKSAMEHAAEGLFVNAPVTTWTRGSNQEVYWASNVGHQGGYAYRLCKLPYAGAIDKVTEQCFQNGHLKFAGDKTWTYKNIRVSYSADNYDHSKFQERNLIRVTSGTNPRGSEWAQIAVPHSYGGWGFKDLVEVPSYLSPGEYVLSFRWDAEKTAQVWQSCANIRLV